MRKELGHFQVPQIFQCQNILIFQRVYKYHRCINLSLNLVFILHQKKILGSLTMTYFLNLLSNSRLMPSDCRHAKNSIKMVKNRVKNQYF